MQWHVHAAFALDCLQVHAQFLAVSAHARTITRSPCCMQVMPGSLLSKVHLSVDVSVILAAIHTSSLTKWLSKLVCTVLFGFGPVGNAT